MDRWISGGSLCNHEIPEIHEATCWENLELQFDRHITLIFNNVVSNIHAFVQVLNIRMLVGIEVVIIRVIRQCDGIRLPPLV